MPGGRLRPTTFSVVLDPSLDPTSSPSGPMTVRISSATSSAPGGDHVIENAKVASMESYAPDGTFTVMSCSSTAELGRPEQELVGFDPIGIVPPQLSITVWPAVVGTVTEALGGVEPGATAATVATVATAAARTMSGRTRKMLRANRTGFIFSPRGRWWLTGRLAEPLCPIREKLQRRCRSELDAGHYEPGFAPGS